MAEARDTNIADDEVAGYTAMRRRLADELDRGTRQ